MVIIYYAYGNPSQPRGGGGLIGSTLAAANGVWTYNLTGGRRGSDVTVMACNTSGSCSEMSPRPITYIPYLRK